MSKITKEEAFKIAADHIDMGRVILIVRDEENDTYRVIARRSDGDVEITPKH